MSGTLLSHDAMERLMASGEERDVSPEKWSHHRKHLRSWHAELRQRLGPASGARTVFDLVAAPLAAALGFAIVPVAGGRQTLDAELRSGAGAGAVMVVTAWGQPARSVWRHAVHRGLAHGVRWAICVNGPALCVFDAGRAYARRFVEFDLAATFDSEQSLAVLCGLVGVAGLVPAGGGAPLERAIAYSERHRSRVRLSLRAGVYQALVELISAFRRVSSRNAGWSDSHVLDESLVVVYRLLFLLFAEARGLVPTWHPVYRDSYSLGSVRHEIERGVSRGLWETLQAVARLAHRGCAAGSLKVPPFNGRLFSPAHAPLAASVRLDDRCVAAAMRALTTRVDGGRREEIAYADLGVEQLGGVYEHLLDFDVSTAADGSPALIGSGRRKATGSFYTPRSLTEFIVRRTLGPVVEGRTPDEILALRVLDPAMGSGAFLVAACRFLAAAYETALIREGALGAADVGERDRADFRRAVAQRCLYGVDVNPMAVQLARLSLWLATLAADKPLTFLDHRLRVGHSLVGASIEDLMRDPVRRRTSRERELPLFAGEALQHSLSTVVGVRRGLADEADDSLEQVRQKERTVVALDGADGPLQRWRVAADLWCSAFFDAGSRTQGTFGALRDYVLEERSALPRHTATRLVARGRSIAATERVLHWTLEFPEIFYDQDGRVLPDDGFDVVLGNPPWEMLRGDSGRAGLIAYVKGSGQYRLQGDGHSNLYQLFFERGLRLLKREGRCGVILPAGFATDHGCGTLRRHLFERARVETFTILDNRNGIFPIHRGLKFLLLTFQSPGKTTAVPMRSGVGSVEVLESIADTGDDPAALGVPRALLERVSGESLAVPDVRSAMDLRILTTITLAVPALSATEGWGATFGRELNATEDRPHFSPSPPGLPVLEGKQLRPFRVAAEEARFWIPRATAAGLLDPGRSFERARLAYRDVASAGNRMTLIAAIVPAGAVTTHTVFCLKTMLDDESQWFLCGVLNSYVANYIIRMRVNSHVTTALLSRLPVPVPARSDPRFGEVAACARTLTAGDQDATLARLNATVAALYGLGASDFEHVLGTFPLIPAASRAAALAAFLQHAASSTGYHSFSRDPYVK